MQTVSQEYKLVQLMGAEDFTQWVEFLYEGWQSLASHNRIGMTAEAFYKQVLKVVCGPPGDGAVFVVTSKNDKPLSFFVLIDNSESFEKESVVIYAGYSNGKSADVTTYGVEVAKIWARENGFQQLQACTRRLNGASARFFRKKLGFNPVSIMYSQQV